MRHLRNLLDGRHVWLAMHLGEGQDHLTDEFALRGGQLEEGIEGFALQVANAFVSALFLLLD